MNQEVKQFCNLLDLFYSCHKTRICPRNWFCTICAGSWAKKPAYFIIFKIVTVQNNCCCTSRISFLWFIQSHIFMNGILKNIYNIHEQYCTVCYIDRFVKLKSKIYFFLFKFNSKLIFQSLIFRDNVLFDERTSKFLTIWAFPGLAIL